MQNPQVLIEVSWEVCNMVGGIHTALASKAHKMQEYYGNRYITIGPDISRMNEYVSEFREEAWQPELLTSLSKAGLECRMGRWLVPGEPKCLLVNFAKLHESRDRILAGYWETYKLHSLHGGWDYLEPLFFGHAAGQVIQHFYQRHLKPRGERTVVHCHEWMSSAAILDIVKDMPEIGTVFTTHATALGRGLAAINREVNLDEVRPHDPGFDNLAHEVGVSAKHSMETITARIADTFTTVSEIASEECIQVLGRKPDLILQSALSDDFDGALIPDAEGIRRGRERLFHLAELTTGSRYDRENTDIVISAGRYEFHNKGVDLLLDTLAKINESFKETAKQKAIGSRAIVFLMYPTAHSGPKRELINTVRGRDGHHAPFLSTHDLRDEWNDAILQKLRAHGMQNQADQPVHVILIPVYLDGHDPLIPEKYYQLLAGADVTAFPFYYEPWGYTPLESLSFGIPTITSDRTGFGAWAAQQGDRFETGVVVLPRKGLTYEESCREMHDRLMGFFNLASMDRAKLREAALRTSQRARWKHWGKAYFQAHSAAIKRADERMEQSPGGKMSGIVIPRETQPVQQFDPHAHMRSFTVHNKIPTALEPLTTLARNIWWHWNPDVLALFSTLDPALWDQVGHNPTVFLNRIRPDLLERAADSKDYLSRLRSALDRFHKETARSPRADIAFFCAEYGFASCLKFYSGGLGILAGDLVKTASDMNLPMCAVGLAYHMGYFKQRISHEGTQENLYEKNDFHSLPMQLVTNEDGSPLIVSVPFPSGPVHVRGWRLSIGKVDVYLLDTDFPANRSADRAITNILYGGDRPHRARQEYILGVGGYRFLRALGLNPSVYHMNEGHSAFLVLARLADLVKNENLKYDEALEFVRHTSIFTTHTPVPAGHDHFAEEVVRPYLAAFEEALHVDWNTVYSLGLPPHTREKHDFSMTYLSIHGSIRINGVSEIHGAVSRKMFAEAYPSLHASEVPVESITNGVHIPTWLAAEWQDLFTRDLGKDWRSHLRDESFWDRVRRLDPAQVWKTHQTAKARLLSWVKEHVRETYQERREDPAHLSAALAALDSNPLVIGFARRFAPYKRAHLLFTQPERLQKIISEAGRPVVFLYSGKAHPADALGQSIIKRTLEIARDPAFIGKIVFVENYDIDIAQMLVSGCDVWLNTPTRPLEASGTSGMKAAVNGCLNLSVPDGWWCEGYNGRNGWIIGQRTYDAAIPEDFQLQYDSSQIYTLLEQEVLPAFFERGSDGIPHRWVEMMKESIATITPRFSSERMLHEYQTKFYEACMKDACALGQGNHKELYVINERRQRLASNWDTISFMDVQMEGLNRQNVYINQPIRVRIEVSHPNIRPEELTAQVVLARSAPEEAKLEDYQTYNMKAQSSSGERQVSVWETTVTCNESGPYAIGVRVMPSRYHEDHDLDALKNLVKWL